MPIILIIQIAFSEKVKTDLISLELKKHCEDMFDSRIKRWHLFFFQNQSHETFAKRLTVIYILKIYQIFLLMHHKSQNVANKQ